MIRRRLRGPLFALGIVLGVFVSTAASCDAMYGCSRSLNPSGYSYTSTCTNLQGNSQKLFIVLNDGAAVVSSIWSSHTSVVAIIPAELRHMRVTRTYTDITPPT